MTDFAVPIGLHSFGPFPRLISVAYYIISFDSRPFTALSVCKVRLRPGAKIARWLCFGPLNHTTLRMHHVRDTRLSSDPVCTQVDDARANDQSDYKPERMMGYQPFAVILEQRQNGLIL